MYLFFVGKPMFHSSAYICFIYDIWVLMQLNLSYTTSKNIQVMIVKSILLDIWELGKSLAQSHTYHTYRHMINLIQNVQPMKIKEFGLINQSDEIDFQIHSDVVLCDYVYVVQTLCRSNIYYLVNIKYFTISFWNHFNKLLVFKALPL